MFDLHRMSAAENPRTILRKEEVLRRTGLKTTRLYELIKMGEFPAQVSIGARAVGWYEDEVQNWIDLRPATDARRGQSGDGMLGTRSDKCREPKLPTRVVREPVAPVETAHDVIDQSLKTKTERRRTSDAAGGRSATAAYSDARELEELKRIGVENSRLKILLANLMLENDALRLAMAGISDA